MNFKLILMFSIAFQSYSSQAMEPNCALPDTYCMEEFQTMAQQATSIESLVSQLPTHVKQNLTLKRGNNIEKIRVGRLGPHGHKASSSNSSSASPEEPRAFVWDQKSGFTATWNSGNPNHRASNRVDLYHFDFKTNEHKLTGWIPPKDGAPAQTIGAQFVDSSGDSCIKCHGAVQRPIFPMYPDWPQFYGEFNDEMSSYPAGAKALRTDLRTMGNDFQPKEKAFYFDFLDNAAQTNARYTPLYDVQPSSINNPHYPFRPDTTVRPFSSTSRAFYHRPNLRIGVLYNRLTALQTFEKIKKSPVFKKFPDVMFYSMLDCNWDVVDARKDILGNLLNKIQTDPALNTAALKNVTLRGAEFSAAQVAGASPSDKYLEGTRDGTTVYYKHKNYDESRYRQVPYEDLLTLLGLKIADMDIRFKHNTSLKVAKGYKVFDPKAFYHTDNVMDIGYTNDKYPANPVCETRNRPPACNFSYDGTYMEGMKYFNSYFDGSATMSELLAAQMLTYLTQQNFSGSDSDLNDVKQRLSAKIPDIKIYFETLNRKYGGSTYADRLVLDKKFFNKMDALSPWIQLPYPPDLLNIQNREGFWGTGPRTSGIRLRHAQWKDLSDRTARVKNEGENLCWKVYKVMEKRYRTMN